MSCYPHTLKIVLPPPSCPDSNVYTASNANLTGEGVFFQKTGNEFQFYGITNTDGYLVVSLDTDNNAIVVNLDENLIAGSIPDATTSVKGKVQLATDVQAQAKTSTTLVLTPSNLAALVASTTFAGLTEYATNAETQAGTSTALAVTPAGLLSVTDQLNTPFVTANPPETETTTPLLAGQLLVQKNNRALYVADSTGEGDWVGITVDNGVLSGTVNFSGATLQVGGVTVPADCVLMTSNVAGDPTGVAVSSNFLSSYNVTTYTLGTYSSSRTVTDSASVTLPELADLVYTLINDMKLCVKPAPDA